MQSSGRFGFLIFLFAYSVFFSHDISAFPHSRSRPATTIPLPRTQTPSPSITPNYHPLLPRNGVDLGNGWHMSIDNYELFIPLGYATHELVRFYREIITSSHTEWHNNHPALPQFKLAFGALELIFRSNSPIPWNWVSEFGETLASAAFDIHDICYPSPHWRID